MSVPRAALLLALAAGAAVPASAHAFVEVCVHPPITTYWVCHAPELAPGCVYGFAPDPVGNFSVNCPG
jgi:hypothetical protein